MQNHPNIYWTTCLSLDKDPNVQLVQSKTKYLPTFHNMTNYLFIYISFCPTKCGLSDTDGTSGTIFLDPALITLQLIAGTGVMTPISVRMFSCEKIVHLMVIQLLCILEHTNFPFNASVCHVYSFHTKDYSKMALVVMSMLGTFSIQPNCQSHFRNFPFQPNYSRILNFGK